MTQNLTYPDIVARLYDVKRLATLPAVGQTSGLFSSGDRRSRYDQTTDTYIDWHANDDYAGIDPDGTMCDIQGPGVIWRIWSAKAGTGNLEFYVDGSDTPTLAIPTQDLFNNKKPPFNYPELVHQLARGNNFFVPITFQESIRIRGAEDWGRYYHITYTKFPKGTVVPSFTGQFTSAERSALQKANDTWACRGPQAFVSPDCKSHDLSINLAPGQQKLLADFTCPAAITSITMDSLQIPRDQSINTLRDLAISITWDDDDKPSVWSPLGDFFGTAPGQNLYRTMLTGMTEKSYYANWYMPFKKARIVMSNDGPLSQSLNFTIHTAPAPTDLDRLLRYHYKWHRDDFAGFDEHRLATDRWPDWPVLKVDNSAGRFCGFQLHVWNPNHLWNPTCRASYNKPLPPGKAFQRAGHLYEFYVTKVAHEYWFGEGDEKFFVDGEKYPSTFGTGTEDYFGFAWGTSQAFDSALQAQPRNGAADEIGKEVDNSGPGNIGHIAMTRWQIPDNVPFQKSFEATIEKYHPNSWPLLYAFAVSWYQSPAKADYYSPVPQEHRRDYFVNPTPKIQT